MPPKKTGTAAAPKKASSGAVSTHGSYQEMISDAIRNLKERTGSSRQGIKKYIQANNNLGNTTDAAFNTHINRALTNGEKNGVFSRPKGPSGPVKLAKPAAKPAAKTGDKPAKKAATGTKKAAPKKTTAAKKPAPKKAAAGESKANAGRPRKTAPAAAPAVEDKPTVVLGKTKSGRVTKTKAPAGDKPKKAAPKKTAAKKATPKKTATPKKAEA